MRLVLVAVLLALAYRAAPGPVLLEAARRGLNAGFRAALAVELGSLAGDAAWVGVMLVGAAALARAGGFRLAAGGAGGAFLVWVGARALSAGCRGRRGVRDHAMLERAFATGAAISVASPYALPFWLGVSSSLSSRGISHAGACGYVLFSLAFLVTCLVFALAASALISWGRRFLNPRLFFAVDIAAGLILAILGVNLIAIAVTHAIG
jgi:threonine/homoserine/homoserine lactone efflux protein